MKFCRITCALVCLLAREIAAYGIARHSVEVRLDARGQNSLIRRNRGVKSSAPQTKITQQLQERRVKFLVYELPSHLNQDLLACYKDLHGKQLWEDFREERGQNSADVWIHQLLSKHELRTRNPEEATMFFIPFYGFLSAYFNGKKEGNQGLFSHAANQKCNGREHMQRVVDLTLFLEQQESFRKHPEKHVMPVSFWNVAREQPDYAQPGSVIVGPIFKRLQSSVLLVHEPMFASQSDLEQYKQWPGKLVAIPYVAKMDLVAMEMHSDDILQKEPIFFFQGEISTPHVTTPGIQRRKLLIDAFKKYPESWIVDTHKNYSGHTYETGMLKARFCLVPEGDTPTSSRLFDAIAAGCVPMILSDKIALPFADFVDWQAFSLHPTTSTFLATQSGTGQLLEVSSVAESAIKRVAALPAEQLTELQRNLREVRDVFIYGRGSPVDSAKSPPGGAVDALLLATARAMSS
eukprot:TRINITY_DN9198_c0_g1_i1.p1 TRINITY_DN9198_c0_g1~~TRINITY_DN9198_c0_g1_i1.p1  ORF type:complete len:463 (+),score=68.55 TRINITY_DN9198_c0_g1_i1:78-1466(+)